MLPITKGDKFSVVITNKAIDGKELFLKYKPEDYNSREVAGKSYFTFEDSDWTDIANENEDISYMAIKAYTSNVTVDKTKLANLLEEVKDFTPDTNIPQSELYKYYGSLDLAKKGVIILNYQGASTDVTIPSELYSAPVVAIDDEFSCLDENFEEIYITSITIPGTVKSIPERLLSYSPCLESVVLEEGIEEIGNYAFSGCNLNSIDLPDSLRSIGDLAFFNNNIKSVVLGKNIEKIGDKALGYTYSLRKLDKIEDFVISGYAGTAAEEYAKANGFTFVDLSNSEQTDNTTNETAQLMPCA